jgi:hypothetical protein
MACSVEWKDEKTTKESGCGADFKAIIQQLRVQTEGKQENKITQSGPNIRIEPEATRIRISDSTKGKDQGG